MKRTIVFTVLFLLFGMSSAYASHYDLPDIDLVSESVVKQLAADKIDNTEELFTILQHKADRAAFVKKYGMSVEEVDKLAHQLELMQIVGVGPKAATLLLLSGVENVKGLSQANPDELLETLQRVNREQNITGVQPDLTVVRDWIDKSKKIVNTLD